MCENKKLPGLAGFWQSKNNKNRNQEQTKPYTAEVWDAEVPFGSLFKKQSFLAIYLI